MNTLGVNSEKNTHKVYVQDMTITLRYKISMYDLGAHGFNVKHRFYHAKKGVDYVSLGKTLR